MFAEVDKHGNIARKYNVSVKQRYIHRKHNVSANNIPLLEKRFKPAPGRWLKGMDKS